MTAGPPYSEPQPVTATAETTQRGGIVVPHAINWRQRFAAFLIYAFIRVISSTLRYRWTRPPETLLEENRPYIFCIWHNRLLLSLIMYQKYTERGTRPSRLAAIVSASRDGAVMARVLELFKVQPARGSSSRRAAQALLELTTWAERGYDLALTPDGPRGPCYVIKPGPISLAQVTGRPIVPASYHVSWKLRLKSWDRFQLPLPFSHVVFRVGDPISVPREASETEREALRVQLETKLKELTED